ncbi:MAG TPA: ABC transporter permease [Pyrinomonadaceae bacterium]|nr:ABC transporter permease [Pyrinomonadaceae bacterium]
MRKFFAVVKREYIQRVRTKFFVIMTILAPALMAGFTVVPALMFSIKAGGPTRLAIVDQTGKMYERVARAIGTDEDLGSDESQQQSSSPPAAVNANPKERVDEAEKLIHGSFQVEEVHLAGRSMDDVTNDLETRVRSKTLDGYLILPANLLKDGQPEFHARNTADPFTKGHVEVSVNRAVRSERLVEANIDEKLIRKMSEPVKLRTFNAGGKGGESKGEANFYLVFGLSLMIYMSVLLYGQLVLGAVIEEKETRIAEILFSSMRSFPLMIGKLIGVSLVALTQLSIWGLAFATFTAVGIPVLASRGVPISLHVPPMVFVYFVIYFLLGFFIYASIYAVVGSMVTTTQEGGQLAFPVVLMLIAGFYLSFSIIRSPNSSLAFWASMFPFFAPITMLVRIVTETPPFWQIALSLGIGFATVVGLIWLTSRIYRVGMLMTGKKASIPEVWRWLRQA